MSERAGLSGRNENTAATGRERFGRFAWVFEWTARWSWRRFDLGFGYDWRWGSKSAWIGAGWFLVTVEWHRPMGWYDSDNAAFDWYVPEEVERDRGRVQPSRPER